MDHFKNTLRLAKKAKELYLNGINRREIAILFKKSTPQIDRYIKIMGGLSLLDKAEHLKKRSKRNDRQGSAKTQINPQRISPK